MIARYGQKVLLLLFHVDIGLPSIRRGRRAWSSFFILVGISGHMKIASIGHKCMGARI